MGAFEFLSLSRGSPKSLFGTIKSRTVTRGPFGDALSHFVFVRFGIGVFDPEWLRYRLDLFKAVTLPSIKAQKNSSFRLIVQVDEELPEPFSAELHGAIENLPYAQLDFLELHSDRAESAKRIVHSESADIFIVIRIDDDDAISATTLSALQQAVRLALAQGLNTGA